MLDPAVTANASLGQSAQRTPVVTTQAVRSRLTADERNVAARLEQLQEKRWASLPVLVDVVETVNWSGANSS